MLIAKCSSCGAIFQSLGIRVSGRSVARLSGNKETCPHCGHLADIADGVFSTADGILKIITAPDITKEMYAAFLGLAKKAQDKEIDESQLVEAVTAIHPQLGAALKLAKKNKKLGMVVILILAISRFITFDVKIDANRLFDQIFNGQSLEYLLQEDEFQKPNEELGGDDADSAEGRSEAYEPKTDMWVPRRRDDLLVSASYITISRMINH